MVDKLKLFVFQSCRGNQKDPGITIDGAQAQRKVAGVLTDAIIAYSTVQDYVSWRHKTDGSYYIQTLCKVFKKHGHEYSVQKLFHKVQEELQDNEVDGFKITQETKEI